MYVYHLIFGIILGTGKTEELKPAIIFKRNGSSHTSENVYIGFPTCASEEKRSCSESNDIKTLNATMVRMQKDLQKVIDTLHFSENESPGKLS